ncbi:unnamed protein product, partial [Pylaiella littoralis]
CVLDASQHFFVHDWVRRFSQGCTRNFSCLLRTLHQGGLFVIVALKQQSTMSVHTGMEVLFHWCVSTSTGEGMLSALVGVCEGGSCPRKKTNRNRKSKSKKLLVGQTSLRTCGASSRFSILPLLFRK